MSVDRLGPDDAEAWRAIRLEMLSRHPEGYATTLREFEAQSLDAVAASLKAGWVLGIRQEGALVGTLVLDRHGKASTRHRASLGAVYVRPETRGSGVGRRLVDAAEAAALEAGVIQLELIVTAGNAGAIAFWRRCGFVEQGRLVRAMRRDGRFHDGLQMVRLLDR